MKTKEEIKVLIKREQLKNSLKGDKTIMNTSTEKIQVRELLKIKEVRDFYTEIQVSLRSGQFVSSALYVPELITDRIEELIPKYSSLYNEVQVVPIGTDGRVLINVGELTAVWNNDKKEVAELDSSIDLLELEDIKLAGNVSVPNCVLEDSLIDTVLYLDELLAKALATGIDEGIINGEGDYTTVYEPIGILKELPVENKVTVPFTTDKILSSISLIDIGNKKDIGEVTAVMKRMTYYKDIMALANTTLPYPNINGLRVSFSSAVEDEKIILGDMKEYLLGKRKTIHLANSTESKFEEEQTVFRIVGRYDGKPHIKKAFVQLTKQV